MTRANFEPLRSLAFGGISASYAAVGTPSDHEVRAFCLNNNTQGDMIFSRDNTLTEGEVFVKAGSYKLWDVQSNRKTTNEDKYVLDKGTQWYVKQITAPVSGAVYIENLR